MTAYILCTFSVLLVQSGGITWGEDHDFRVTVGNSVSVFCITLLLHNKSSLAQPIINEVSIEDFGKLGETFFNFVVIIP